VYTEYMNTSYQWYAQLQKPTWAPPSWLFGPVWSVLYIGIFISYGYVLRLFLHKSIPFSVLLPFILNIVFNAIFTPLQFSLRSNVLAMVDIVLVLVTLIWALLAIYPYAKWVALVNVPYLLWVMFATTLQITVTYLNR
jgi:tryptophan-rich sensory protein